MPAYVKHTTAVNAAVALTQALAITNTAGNLLVLTIGNRYATAVVTVTDTGGNTWTDACDMGTTNGSSIWYCTNAVAAGTITVTANVASSWTLDCIEFSGANGGVDQHPTPGKNGASSGVETTFTTGTTTLADEVVVAVISQNATTSTFSLQTAGYTLLGTLIGSTNISEAAYLIVSATGTQTFSHSSNKTATWYALIATFKASGAVVAAPPPRLSAQQAMNRAANWCKRERLWIPNRRIFVPA